MTTLRTVLAFPLVALMMAISGPAFADQQHIVSPNQLTAVVVDHVATQDANRATIREAIGRPEVEGVASRLGVDLARATAAIDTMSGPDLEKAAQAAQQVNDQLVGGASTVVISTTTIIIILLLVIILIIAVK